VGGEIEKIFSEIILDLCGFIFYKPEGQNTTGLPVDEWLGGDMLKCTYGN